MVLRHPDRELPNRPITNPVGIDKGLKHRMTLSDGTRIPARQLDRKVIIKRQSVLSRSMEAHKQREKAEGKKTAVLSHEKEEATIVRPGMEKRDRQGPPGGLPPRTLVH